MLWLYLASKSNIFSDKLKVLHFAPEFIIQNKLKKMQNLNYVSTDFVSDLASIKMDITDIEFRDNIFDLIICNHVLEHIENDIKAISELFRVLKSGGWAMIQCPVDYNREITYEDPSVVLPEDRLKKFGQFDHVRVYGRDFIRRLEKPGFKVEVIDLCNEIDANYSVKYGLNKDEKLYQCIKP